MTSIIESNKLASVFLALVILALILVIVFSVVAQANGFEIAGASTLRYCVSSGGVCTGGA